MKPYLPKIAPLSLLICTATLAARGQGESIPLPQSSDFTWVPGINASGIGNSATTATIVQNLAAAIENPAVGNTDLSGWFGGTGQGHSSSGYGGDISILSADSFTFTSRPRLSGEYVALGVKLPGGANSITLGFDYAGTIPAGQSNPTGTIGYSLWSVDTTTGTATELIPFAIAAAGTPALQSHDGQLSEKTHLLVIWNTNPPGGGGSGIVSGISLAYIPYATYVATRVSPTTRNGRAGVKLLQQALETQNPQTTAPGSALAAALDAVDAGTLTDAGAAAVAGASTAVPGMAAHADVERQLRAIRNRTTTMGVDQSVVNPDLPYFNAWMNAEGDLSQLLHHGTEAGYKLSSWGGTVGFDVDITPTLTAGMALTAMYGSLTATGPDAAEGDLDTWYMSAFARYCARAWTHTLVLTAGFSDIELRRHAMGVPLHSKSHGTGVGILYELGRVFPLNEDATACLQPVFDISWRHTGVDSCRESGSNLALALGHQRLDTISLGLGARFQASVGETSFNRSAILECRLLATLDTGDTRCTRPVSLAGLTTSIESAKASPLGMEAGAGITLPLGENAGSMFLDASVELRSGFVDLNGTLGYRLNF